MKKILMQVFMLAMTMSFVACSSDEETIKTSSAMTIQASIESEAPLRTALQGNDTKGYKVVWTTGDAIFVGTKLFRLSKGAGTTAAEFSEAFVGQQNPLNDGTYDAWYGVSGMQLKNEQTYEADRITNAPMHARITVQDQIPTPAKFKNLCGLLRLTIKGTETLTSITISAEQPMAGSFEFTANKEDIYMVDNNKTSVTLNCSNNYQGVTLTPEGTDFYIALPQSKYSNVQFVLTSKKGVTCTKKLKSDKTLDIYRSQITPFTFSADFVSTELKVIDLGDAGKWANMNVGATNEADYGTYFAWGEVTGCKRNPDGSIIPAIMDGYPEGWTGHQSRWYISGRPKTNYEDWDEYKWNHTYTGDTWNQKYAPGRSTLASEDDAAYVNLGSDWRMPTLNDFSALYGNCPREEANNYKNSGVAGIIFYKKKEDGASYSLSDPHIFLPYAGDRKADSFTGVGQNCWYWSSTSGQTWGSPGYNDITAAGFLNHEKDQFSIGCTVRPRYLGMPIRAVYDPKDPN